MNIFLLEADVRNFRAVAAPDWFFANFPMDEFCVGLPMAERWKSFELDELVEEQLVQAPNTPGNLASFHLTSAIVLDAKAKSTLETLLGPGDVEFLPLSFKGEPRWLMNVIRVVDALDEPHCELSRFTDGAVMTIRKYVFRPSSLEGCQIFKTPQTSRAETYVSDAFVDCIKSAALTGIQLRKL